MRRPLMSGRVMARSWQARALTVASAAVLGILVTAFASCATNAASEPPADDAASPVPEANSPLTDADAPDTGCEPSDPGCTTEVVPCETVSWCLSSSPLDPRLALTAVWGSGAADVWAVGGGGAILHHDGDAWALTPSGHPTTFFAVWGSGPRDVWVVSTYDVMLHGTGFKDGSAQWENVSLFTHSTIANQQSISLTETLRAVWGTSVNDVRVAGPRVTMSVEGPGFRYAGPSNHAVKSRTSDGGVLWRALPGQGDTIRTIWGSSADDVWMAGDDGVTLHGTPYLGELPHPDLVSRGNCWLGCFPGCTTCAIASDTLEWAPVDSQSTSGINAVWGSSASDVWAVGEVGSIRRIRTGDDRWQKVESPTTDRLHAIWGSGPDDVWIVGENATVLHYDGATLTPSSVQLPLGPRPSLRGVWGSGPSDVWIVGDRGTILHYAGPKPGVVEGAGGS